MEINFIFAELRVKQLLKIVYSHIFSRIEMAILLGHDIRVRDPE